MFRKTFAALLCLAVLTAMSAISAWGAPLYSVSTKIDSLGTKLNLATGVYEPVIGGVIRTRTLGTNGAEVLSHNKGIRYTTVPNTKQVEVEVDPAEGYKIASITKASYEVVEGVVKLGPALPLTLDSKDLHTETFVDSTDPLLKGRTQFLVATFAIDTASTVVSKTWQLQVQNNNGRGMIVIARGADSYHYDTVGKPLVKNYIDTTPVTVTVYASVGYFIDYVVINGKKTFQPPGTTTFTDFVDATFGASLRSYNVGYRKAPIAVDTTNGSVGGISPLNPQVDPFGTVRLIITPTGSKTKVQTVTTTGGYLTLTDRFGEAVTLPHYGPVKATITGITSAITVTASYGYSFFPDPWPNCTQTCHMDPSLPPDVKARLAAADADWQTSKHRNNPNHRVDCVGCHQTMPGPVLTAENNCKTCHSSPYAPPEYGPVLSASHDQGRSCLNCHNEHSLKAEENCETCHSNGTQYQAWAAGPHGTSAGHTTGICQRCHTTEGAQQGAATGWTGGYAEVLSKNIYTPVTATDGIGCFACHKPHDGSLRSAMTLVDGVLASWDPNSNAADNDQYDLCTSCHTLTDNAGAVVGNYHDGSSIEATRTISDSHFDNPATGTIASDTTIEGYVIRTQSAAPCADCHNLHSADVTIQRQWAESRHAGRIIKAKADAVCGPALDWFNATYPSNTATACTDLKSVAVAPRTNVTTGTVSELYGKTAAGVAALKAAGATHASGAAWTQYNWDDSTGTSSDRKVCQRCHTATGAANFLTNSANYNPAENDFSHLAGWATAKVSPQQELLYCWGCHSDSQSGALRNPGPLTFDYSPNPNDTVSYADVGASNVCVACHSGNLGIGATIQSAALDFTNANAIHPHDMNAAGVLMGRTGYEFAGVTYTDGYHQNIGVANAGNTGTSGPCVACHMAGPEKHTFKASGSYALCANCHEGGWSVVELQAAEAQYNAALEELKGALQVRGIWFTSNFPFFVSDNGCVPGAYSCTSFDPDEANNGRLSAGEMNQVNQFKNWEDAVPGVNGRDTMGAAFNYDLLVHEPGAFAHNPTYAYQLIRSSLDFLQRPTGL